MTEFDTDVHDDTAVIAVRGRLDMVAAPGLREHIRRTVDDGSAYVVIDLGPTEFIDSSGLGAIVAGLKLARQAGGDLRIANVEGQVGVVLSLTNLDRILRPYPSVAEALGAER